jgi:hypothetical protein
MSAMKLFSHLALVMLCLAVLPASTTTQAYHTQMPDRAAPLAIEKSQIKLVGHLGTMVTLVAIQGNYAYIGGGYEFAVLALDNQAVPQRLGHVLLPNAIQGIAIAGPHAYILIGPDVLGVVDVSSPAAPKLVGRVGVPGSPQSSGVAPDIAVAGQYVYVSGTTGLHIFDRSNPVAPVAVGTYAPKDVVLSDLDVAGHYVYISGSVPNSSAGIRIVDVGNPAAPIEVGSYTRPGVVMLRVVVRDTYAYIGSSKGLRIVDVSNPAAPGEVSVTPLPGQTSLTGYNLVVVGNYAYLATEWVLNPNLYVVDVSRPASPHVMDPIALPPGDLSPIGMAGSGQFVVLALRNSGLTIYAISTPSTPASVTPYRTLGLVVDIAARDQHVYTIGASLRIVDVSNPAAPLVAGGYQPPPGVSFTKIALADRYAYLGGSRYTNLSTAYFMIVDSLNPVAPIGALALPGQSVRDLAVAGSYAYIITNDSLHIVDVSNPAAPTVAGVFARPGNMPGFYSIAVADGHAYISSSASDGNLLVVDVTTPAAPEEAGRLKLGGELDIAGGYLYVASGHCPYFLPCTGSLSIADISTPQSPTIIGQVQGTFTQVAVAGPYAYLVSADSERELQVADVANPRSPRIIGFYDSPDSSDLMRVKAIGNSIVLVSQFEFSILRYHELTVAGQFMHANRMPAPMSGVRLASSVGNTVESGPQGSYNLPRMPSGTHSITPTLDGYTFWPPARTVTLPPSSTGQDFIVLTGPVSTTLAPGTAATLAYTDTQGLRTQLDIGASAVSQTTTLILTPTLAVDGPQMVFAGHAFDLVALRNGTPVPDFSFDTPITVTIGYSQADVRFVSEKHRLGLWWWNENGWKQSSELCGSAVAPMHDQANKILRAPVCRSGKLALLGPTHRVQLPIVTHMTPPSN